MVCVYVSVCLCANPHAGHKRRITSRAYPICLNAGTEIKFVGGYPLTLAYDILVFQINLSQCVLHVKKETKPYGKIDV